jgi:hypothetical protein
MRRSLIVIATLLTLAAGCASDCEEACDHAVALCAGATAIDRGYCVDTCEENLSACGNQAERIECVASAPSCAAIDACPPCR